MAKILYPSSMHHTLWGNLKDTVVWKGVAFCMIYSSLSLWILTERICPHLFSQYRLLATPQKKRKRFLRTVGRGFLGENARLVSLSFPNTLNKVLMNLRNNKMSY